MQKLQFLLKHKKCYLESHLAGTLIAKKTVILGILLPLQFYKIRNTIIDMCKISPSLEKQENER